MEDPWFITMRAPGHIRLTPRNAKGWASFALLMFVLLVPLLWVVPHARLGLWVPIGHFVFAVVVVIAFLRFAGARSDVIDLTELRRDTQARKNARRRR